MKIIQPNVINEMLHQLSISLKVRYLILTCIALYFLVLLSQIFLFSNSFTMSWLRQIDDAVYHEDLRRIHESISGGDFKELLKLNNNGYGWLFWIINGLLTYPLYLIQVFGVERPLIVSGRIICWIFSIGSAYVIFKIVKIYTNNTIIQFCFLLTYLLFPHISFWAMRFSSDTPSFFFSTLAFYFSIKYKKQSLKTLLYVALLLGAGIGIKLTTIVIAPIIVFNVLQRLICYGDNLTKYKFIFIFIVGLLFSTIFFLNPGIYLYFYNSEYYQYTIDTIRVYASLNGDVGDSNVNLIEIYKSSLGAEYIGIYSVTLFLSAIIVSIVYDIKNNKIDYTQIVALISLVFVFLFLALTVKKGVSYISVYYHAVSFLICVAYIAIDKKFKKYGSLIAIIFFMAFSYENFNKIINQATAYYNFSNSPRVIELSLANDEIKLIIDKTPKIGNKKIISLVDYRAIFPYTTLDTGFKTIALLDDLSVRKKWSPSGFDYIVLSRDSPLMDSITVIKDQYRFADKNIMNVLNNSQQDLLLLLNDGIINETKYNKIYDKNTVIVFERN
jgi:hypothetical protein